MDRDAVLIEVDGQVARITLNRPEQLNAMNLAWIDGLNRAVEAAAAESGLRVVLVAGAGRAFCAGLDLDMLGGEGMPPGFYEGQERAFLALERLDAIVVAALHGHCLGGGLQLAIACDLRVASSECRLGLPAVHEGLFPGMAPFRLPRLIGLGQARRLILSGELVGAEEALRLGLVDYVVPAERWQAGLEEIIHTHLSTPRTAAIASKRLLARAYDAPIETVYEESRPLLRECLASPEVAAAAEAWGRRADRRG